MLDKLDCTLRLTVHPAGEPSAHGFGPGTAQLLRGVERYGSLNRAAKEMGMAYSKAWTGMKNLEELFGFSLMERHGSYGSRLTEAARQLLAVFDGATLAARTAVADYLGCEALLAGLCPAQKDPSR